jgi:hypothetical protein
MKNATTENSGDSARLTLPKSLGIKLNESVLIHTEFFEAEGRIRAVRAEGYGVQFFNEVDEAVINRIVEEYGFKVSDSFLARRN